MRNPFKRPRRAPGASADWDESKHVDLGDDFVSIPEEQLPAETVERLTGVQILWDDNGRPCVGVNLDTVEAETDAWVARVSEEAADRAMAGEDAPGPSDRDYQVATEAIFNNPANWMREGEEVDPDTRVAVFEIDLLTARIKRGTEPN